MRDNPDYRAANARAQPGIFTVVCLTTAGRNSPDDGFYAADPAVTIRSRPATTFRTASAPTATNAWASIPLVSIPIHWNGRRHGMDRHPLHWNPMDNNGDQSTARGREQTEPRGVPTTLPATNVPRQPFLPIYRRLVLPVHLLGRGSLAALLGCIGLVAGDVKLQDDGVVDDPVNRRGGGHGVREDALPLREDQVGRDAQRPAFVAFCDEATGRAGRRRAKSAASCAARPPVCHS